MTSDESDVLVMFSHHTTYLPSDDGKVNNAIRSKKKGGMWSRLRDETSNTTYFFNWDTDQSLWTRPVDYITDEDAGSEGPDDYDDNWDDEHADVELPLDDTQDRAPVSHSSQHSSHHSPHHSHRPSDQGGGSGTDAGGSPRDSARDGTTRSTDPVTHAGVSPTGSTTGAEGVGAQGDISDDTNLADAPRGLAFMLQHVGQAESEDASAVAATQYDATMDTVSPGTEAKLNDERECDERE